MSSVLIGVFVMDAKNCRGIIIADGKGEIMKTALPRQNLNPAFCSPSDDTSRKGCSVRAGPRLVLQRALRLHRRLTR